LINLLKPALIKVANTSLSAKISTFFIISLIVAATVFVYADTSVKGNYYFKIAASLDEHNPGGSTEAIKYYNRAIKSYLGAGDNDNAVKSYISLGLLHYKFGNSLQVERVVLAALDLGRDNMSDETQAKSYLLLGSTLEPEKAKVYLEKSLELSKRHNLHGLIAEGYYLLGLNSEYKANFEGAAESYLKAADTVKDFSILDRSFNVQNLYERLAEVYAGGGEIDNAIKYYSEALSYTSRNERGFVTANYMKVIGDLYHEKNNYAKACEMWHQAQEEYAFFGAMAPFTISTANVPHLCTVVG
jgi:tetratricopeptide (TPR) repeat protein